MLRLHAILPQTQILMEGQTHIREYRIQPHRWHLFPPPQTPGYGTSFIPENDSDITVFIRSCGWSDFWARSVQNKKPAIPCGVLVSCGGRAQIQTAEPLIKSQCAKFIRRLSFLP